MKILESIQQIKITIEENGLNIDRSIKGQHWLYRSSNKIPEYVDDELIASLKGVNKRELNRLCDDLSFLRETNSNLEKMVMNELNYREFGTAKHTRQWW